MERKVGEIFTCDGKTYQVVKGITCNGCIFMKEGSCYTVGESLGPCDYTKRTDKTSIIFKEINNMEIKNNQLTIDIPEGMEIDLVNSDLAKGIIKFKQSNVTYTDVEDTLNLDKNCIAVSKDNASKLVALNGLMNIAKYYNKGWKPNWKDGMEPKYFILFKCDKDCYNVALRYKIINNNIYFKREEDAQAVINNPNFRSIPLTPSILEKNGWEHKDDIYFKEFPHRKLVIMDENAYIINECCLMFLCPVKFVPQLQHLLFGLGLNHKMEVQVWRQ